MTTGRRLSGRRRQRHCTWRIGMPRTPTTKSSAASPPPACSTRSIRQLHGRLFLGSRLTGRRRIASADRNGNVVFDTDMLAEIERLIGELRIVVPHPRPVGRVPPYCGGRQHAHGAGDQGRVRRARGPHRGLHRAVAAHPQGRQRPQQGDLSADDSRGAGAIVNAARSVRVLNR